MEDKQFSFFGLMLALLMLAVMMMMIVVVVVVVMMMLAVMTMMLAVMMRMLVMRDNNDADHGIHEMQFCFCHNPFLPPPHSTLKKTHTHPPHTHKFSH